MSGEIVLNSEPETAVIINPDKSVLSLATDDLREQFLNPWKKTDAIVNDLLSQVEAGKTIKANKIYALEKLVKMKEVIQRNQAALLIDYHRNQAEANRQGTTNNILIISANEFEDKF